MSLQGLVPIARRVLRPARAYARKTKLQARLLVEPTRPPLTTPDEVAEFSRVQADASFITGNGLASRCRYVLNYDALTVNEHVENEWWFCKADFLDYFFRRLAPKTPFVLFSHNSDRPIDGRFARRLRRKSLVAWFAANVSLVHPKLFALPLGIANPKWPHGSAEALKAVQRQKVAKSGLFDVSFRVETNPTERLRCLAETGLELQAPRSFPEYLERLSSSYFCICPRGNGIDTHRMWEALYVGTVPVVRRSVLTEQHPDLPIVVLDDWSEFRSIDFGPRLYAQTWAGWDTDTIGLDAYCARISRIVERCRATRP